MQSSQSSNGPIPVEPRKILAILSGLPPLQRPGHVTANYLGRRLKVSGGTVHTLRERGNNIIISMTDKNDVWITIKFSIAEKDNLAHLVEGDTLDVEGVISDVDHNILFLEEGRLGSKAGESIMNMVPMIQINGNQNSIMHNTQNSSVDIRSSVAEDGGWKNFILDHIFQIIGALVVAGIVAYLGWG